MSGLPAVAVGYPAWSASNEAWRAEKPLRPWFRSPAPIAVACVMGAMSLDLTALGLGVPEIAPAHHASADAVGLPFEHAANGSWGLAPAVDFIAPSWERPHEPSHDWWA